MRYRTVEVAAETVIPWLARQALRDSALTVAPPLALACDNVV